MAVTRKARKNLPYFSSTLLFTTSPHKTTQLAPAQTTYCQCNYKKWVAFSCLECYSACIMSMEQYSRWPTLKISSLKHLLERFYEAHVTPFQPCNGSQFIPVPYYSQLATSKTTAYFYPESTCKLTCTKKYQWTPCGKSCSCRNKH